MGPSPQAPDPNTGSGRGLTTQCAPRRREWGFALHLPPASTAGTATSAAEITATATANPIAIDRRGADRAGALEALAVSIPSERNTRRNDARPRPAPPLPRLPRVCGAGRGSSWKRTWKDFQPNWKPRTSCLTRSVSRA